MSYPITKDVMIEITPWTPLALFILTPKTDSFLYFGIYERGKLNTNAKAPAEK